MAGALLTSYCGLAVALAAPARPVTPKAPAPKAPVKPGGAPAADSASPEALAFFEREVRPVLAENCYSCHGPKIAQAGLRLDTRATALKGGDRGPAIVPGQPEKSPLVHAVQYADADLQMPPNAKLSTKKIAALEQWVKMGAPYPQDAPAAVHPKAISLEAARKWWSYQPVRELPAPRVKLASWPRKKIDSFLLQKLEEKQLKPSPEADRRTLIRRAYFDLVGLPPTFEQVQQFVNDRSSDAYERLIEELMSRPQYGERWGRHWLDVARYAEDNPTAEGTNPAMQFAFRYRDWVVGAVNEDVPYNQFILKQFAADLLPNSKPEDVAALGYVGLAPVYHKDLALSRDVIETFAADEWDERLDAVSRGLLGATVACARCHDHKFDAFKTTDYYALAGVFASTRLVMRPALNVTDAEAERAAKAREQIRGLEQKVNQLIRMRQAPADRDMQVATVRAQIEQIRKDTPSLELPLYHAVTDAGIWVDGSDPNRTRLDYRPGVPRDLPVFVRGNVASPSKDLVPRHFLTPFSPGEPAPFKIGSGRLELAQNIVGPTAGPLAARVFVNRVWGWHFGTPLVTTTSDFGTQGERPSHPELLDDLAARFIKNGWSLKWLHREIMLSAAYRQSSVYSPTGGKADPGNRLLWRMNRHRLDVEAMRDTTLYVAGKLDLTIGGAPRELDESSNHRRTLYAYISRHHLNPVLRMFDFPDPIMHAPGRDTTTTPLQQLFVLNSPFIQEQARVLADQAKPQPGADAAESVRVLYRRILQREPTERQVNLALSFLKDGKAEVNPELWPTYAQALLGSNEFLFAD